MADGFTPLIATITAATVRFCCCPSLELSEIPVDLVCPPHLYPGALDVLAASDLLETKPLVELASRLVTWSYLKVGVGNLSAFKELQSHSEQRSANTPTSGLGRNGDRDDSSPRQGQSVLTRT